MAKKELTEKEQAFLDYLVSDDCRGDFEKAKLAAGYAKSTSTHALISRLKSEILERAEEVLAQHAIAAAWGMSAAITSAADPDIKERMTAMKEVMDRAGVIKKDGITLGDGEKTAVFILPAKVESASEDDE